MTIRTSIINKAIYVPSRPPHSPSLVIEIDESGTPGLQGIFDRRNLIGKSQKNPISTLTHVDVVTRVSYVISRHW